MNRRPFLLVLTALVLSLVLVSSAAELPLLVRKRFIPLA